MKAPFRWTYPVIAVVATVVAVLLSASREDAIVATTIAVAAAGLTLWDSVRSRSPTPPTAGRAGYALPDDLSDLWLHKGEMSQEAIVFLLDRIDRALAHPSLPVRGRDDVARLSNLPRDQFLSYVESRLSELEAAS